MFDSSFYFKFGSILTRGERGERMTGGLIGSSLLHALAALVLILGMPRFVPEHEMIMSINLVQLGERNAAPPSPDMARLPQEKAREAINPESTKAVPEAQTLPPQATLHQPDKAVPRPLKGPEPDASSDAKPQQQTLPTDNLSARLQLLARLRQPAPPMPPNPRQQNGSGESDATAASANSAAALNATYRVKDFIRAQVMRRLNTDCNALKCGDWVVAIHIVLRPDGRISTAEIVDNSHLSSDSAYRDFAISARDAVLLSSPLTLPPGAYDIAKDIVVDFSSRQVMR